MDIFAFTLRGSTISKWTDAEFLQFCGDNKDKRIERNSNLEVIIKPKLPSLYGYFSGEVMGQLYDWNNDNSNGIVFGASAGFTLPDRSVFAANASWVSSARWNSLSVEEKDSFAPLCPEVVIELCSRFDQIEDLRLKMRLWISNGAELAWLIDPRTQTTYIFRRYGTEEITGFDQIIRGEGPVEGFIRDTSPFARQWGNKKPL